MTLKRKDTVNELVTFTGKIPPQCQDLEEAVLGALMSENNSYLKIEAILFPEHFYNANNESIFKAIKTLIKKHLPFDLLMVTEQLKSDGILDEVGGPYHISRLTSRLGSSAHIEDHARTIVQKWMARELIRISTEIQQKAFDDSEDVKDVLEFANKQLDGLNNASISGSTGIVLSDAVQGAIKRAVDRKEKFHSKKQRGIPTGFADLNRMTNGWQGCDYIILGGRPSIGKTSILLHMIRRSGVWALIISLETTEAKITDRIILSETNDSTLPANNFRSGRMTDENIEEITHDAGARIYECPIIINDSIRRISEIRSVCRILKSKGQLELIALDYIQLVRPDESNKSHNRTTEVGLISHELRAIAKEMGVPMIVVSALNREVEKSNRKPVMADLRECGDIEFDADIIILLSKKESQGETDLIRMDVVKNKDGATGEIEILTNESRTKFFDIDKYNDTPPPDYKRKSGNDEPF